MNDRDLLLRAQLLVALVYTSSAQDTDSAPQVATNGTGFPTVISTPLGVYNSSKTPSKFPWNTYNYCNAPHVNAAHYEAPGSTPNATLVYLNAVIRHHKVNGVITQHSAACIVALLMTKSRTP